MTMPSMNCGPWIILMAGGLMIMWSKVLSSWAYWDLRFQDIAMGSHLNMAVLRRSQGYRVGEGKRSVLIDIG